MFNRKDGGGPMNRSWLIFFLAFVVVALFIDRTPQVSAQPSGPVRLTIAGLAVMVAGLALAFAAGKLAGRLAEERRASATVIFKLAGVLLCGVGAVLVFI